RRRARRSAGGRGHRRCRHHRLQRAAEEKRRRAAAAITTTAPEHRPGPRAGHEARPMSRPDRRTWLRWLGAGGALPAIVGAAEPPANGPAREHSFLTDSDLAFLGAAVDRLIPADDFPSASQA